MSVYKLHLSAKWVGGPMSFKQILPTFWYLYWKEKKKDL